MSERKREILEALLARIQGRRDAPRKTATASPPPPREIRSKSVEVDVDVLPATETAAPPSRPDALRITSVPATRSREDFHLLTTAHAGRTTRKPRPSPRRSGLCVGNGSRLSQARQDSNLQPPVLEFGARRLVLSLLVPSCWFANWFAA